MAGKCQLRTSFSTHFATEASSAEAFTLWGVPSGPIVSDTFTLTVGFVVGLRSQQERRIPGWWMPITVDTCPLEKH